MAWNESLNIELPKIWIEPAVVTSLLPPYYGKAVREYVSWMQQPHSDLRDLSWGDNLNFIYKPLDPSVKEREEKDPTTYFVYEGLYTFFAGLVTGAIPPKDQLDPDRASYLQRQMMVNIAEVMLCINELGTRRMSFDQEHSVENKTYRLLPPKLQYKGRNPTMSTFIGKCHSLISVGFTARAQSFALYYHELDNLRCIPAEINGARTSFVTEFRLDRDIPYPDEQRLMFDCDIINLPWELRSDGRWLPKIGADESLTDQFFGENKHHINLAVLLGKQPEQNDINSIAQTVVTELGLSRLMIK